MADIVGKVDSYAQTPPKIDELESAMRLSGLRTLDAPLFAILPRVPSLGRRIEWIEDKAANLQTTFTATITSAATTFTVAAEDRINPKDIIKIDDEYMYVSSRSTSTLTVTRGFAGTTADVHTTSATTVYVTVVQRGNLEGDDPTASATLKTAVTNQSQIINVSIEMTGTEQAVGTVTPGGEWDYQVQKQMLEWNRLVEFALLHGKINVPTANTTPRLMRGICDYLSSEVISTASTITLVQFNAFIRGIWDNGGQPDILVCDSLFLSIIHEFNVGKLALGSVELPGGSGTVGGVQAVNWISPFGNFRLLVDRQLGKGLGTGGASVTGNCLALTSSGVKLRPLQNRSVSYYENGKSGDKRKGGLVGEYSVQLENEDRHGLIINRTGSA